MGTLRVRRLRVYYRDIFRSYKIIVDDHEVGRIKNGQSVDFPLAAGEHRLRLTINWSTSMEEFLTMTDGQVVVFEAFPFPRKVGYLGG